MNREIIKGRGCSVTINLTPEQERAIHEAIQSGMVRSVDEFIDSAVAALPHRTGGFDKAKARLAGARIGEIRQGVRLDLKGMSIRELAHSGHKY
jgi:Arc/MetJ-type ribon-helix-helix transcriptional regulator